MEPRVYEYGTAPLDGVMNVIDTRVDEKWWLALQLAGTILVRSVAYVPVTTR